MSDKKKWAPSKHESSFFFLCETFRKHSQVLVLLTRLDLFVIRLSQHILDNRALFSLFLYLSQPFLTIQILLLGKQHTNN